MYGLNEKDFRVSQLRREAYLREAEQAREVKAYLAQTRPCRTWRFRLAETLLGVATRLSPYHRELIRGLGVSGVSLR